MHEPCPSPLVLLEAFTIPGGISPGEATPNHINRRFLELQTSLLYNNHASRSCLESQD